MKYYVHILITQLDVGECTSEKPETLRQEFVESVGLVLFFEDLDMCSYRGDRKHQVCKRNQNSPEDPKDVLPGKVTLISNESFEYQ